jgi:hypothetical protein
MVPFAVAAAVPLLVAVELHGHDVIVVVLSTRVCTTPSDVTVEKMRPAEVVTVEFASAWTEEMSASKATRARKSVERNFILTEEGNTR